MGRPVDREYLERLFGLEGHVALVTGGRHGIGRAIALGLARAGARVVTTGRDRSALARVGSELGELGAEHLELELHVEDEANVERAVRAAAERWERLDIVVNNAGRPLRAAALDTSAEEWDAVLGTNLRGPFLVARAAAREMAPGGGGRIVNISSTFARTAVPARAAYAASKAGLEQLTRVLALEWAPSGITVNAVAPATVLTETRQGMFANEYERAARIRQIPLGRLGEADDVVGAVLLLAGAGSFITGATIVVDGGYTLGHTAAS